MDESVSGFIEKGKAKLFYEISRNLASAASPDELLAVIVNYINEPGLQSAMLLQAETDQQGRPHEVAVIAAWEQTRKPQPVGEHIDLDNLPAAKLLVTQPDKPLMMADIAHDKRFDDNTRQMMALENVAALVSVPLRVGDHWVGLFTLNWSNPQNFAPSSEDIYAGIGVQAAAIIYNWQLTQQIQADRYVQTQTKTLLKTDLVDDASDITERSLAEDRNHDFYLRLLALQTACITITSSLDMSQVLEMLAKEMVYFLDLEGCAIHKWFPEAKIITLQSVYALDKNIATAPLGTNYHLADYPFTEKVLLNGRIEQICISQKKIDALELAYMQKYGIKTQILVPMKFNEQTIGLLEVWDCHNERVFVKEELELAQLLANQAAIAIKNARLFKQAQQEIADHEETENALRQSEARNKALLNAVPDIMIRIKRDGTYLDIHAPNPDDLVLPADELIGKNIFDLVDVLSPELCKLIFDAVEQSLKTGEMEVFTYQLNLQGTLRDFEARMVPGGEDEVISIIRNVTELKQLEDQLRHSHKMEAIGQLAAGIAHDFNNILTSILGYAELLNNDPATTPAAQQDLERILRQGQRAAHLVRQILDFARKGKAQKQNVDFKELIQEIVAKLLRRTLPEYIQVTLQAEVDNCWILADPAQLQQVLINLALNARDAMPNGGDIHFNLTQLTFTELNSLPLSDMKLGQWIKLTVSDTGVGIYPDNLPYIFDPFFTTKEVGTGTGLGLAQVFGIIKNHQGHIDVKSEVIKGTTFTIYLPAIPFSQPISQKSVWPKNLIESQEQTILLVEDEPVVLATLEQMLQKLGYQVLTATNGREGFELYQRYQNKIHLVLTDATMPEMGGLELNKKLRQIKPEVKVVIISGYPLDDYNDLFQLNGRTVWLQKPFTLKMLEQTLLQVLHS